MPTRDQMLRAYQQHGDYGEAARELGIPAGQAHLVATGVPADGGDTLSPDGGDQPGMLGWELPGPRLGRLAVRSPAARPDVREWVRRRAAADAPIQAAAQARDAAPAEPRDPEDTDILSMLSRQHDQVTALLKQLKTIPGVTRGGSEVHQSRRASIADMITVALSEHESAEEEQFWPWVRSVLDDGDELAQTAFGQEQESKDLLTALGQTSASEERFDELAEELGKAARTHVAFEDRVLLKLRDAASEEDRAAVGEKFLRAQRPARPNRHASSRPARRRGRVRPETAAADQAPGNEDKG